MVLRMVIARLDMEGNDIYPTNILVVITEYKVLEKHGAVGDQFVTLKVKDVPHSHHKGGVIMEHPLKW